MIIVNKPLPEMNIDKNVYKPFIRSEWFRKNYMWFAYGLMILLFLAALLLGRLNAGSLLFRILLYIAVYAVHESLHILSVCGKGNIYLSHSGLYLWLTPDFVLSKRRFWIFTTLPFLVLTGLTGLVSCFVSAPFAMVLKYIAWVNAITAGSDIINSLLIAVKPGNSFFYRGYYKQL